MTKDPQHPTPSEGLVPDPDGENDLDTVTDGTPDTFDAPMDEDELENELPEEEVYPADTDFEQELEDEEINRYGKED